ncbi:hypothetical protein KAU33_04215 [Candidatus Dependentiae bacterium]|nr:hypothetical protein [Candidatus Dependentiae bacterium]
MNKTNREIEYLLYRIPFIISNQSNIIESTLDLTTISEEKRLKSCEICGESYMGTESDRTCWKHSFKKMYPDGEAAGEFVFG